MGARTDEPTHRGISVDDPRIREAVRTMDARGYDLDRMQHIIGMPREVIEKHLREIKK